MLKSKRILFVGESLLSLALFSIANFNNNFVKEKPSYSKQTITHQSLNIWNSGVVVNENGIDHLYMWGNNFFGQIGNGSIDDVITPVEINVDGGAKGIEGTITHLKIGTYTSAVVINDGSQDHLYMWGNNYYSQIGNGITTDYITVPIEIDIDKGSSGIQGTITNLELGNFFTGAIIEKNGIKNLYSWGGNSNGEIGNENASIKNVDSAIIINPDGGANGIQGNVIDYQVGSNFSMLATQTSDGQQHLFGWGSNKEKQLGDVNFNDFYTANPREINLDGGNTNIQGEIQTLALGSTHAGTIIKKNKTQYLYMWGENRDGQIGNGKISSVADPQIISIPGSNISGSVEHLALGDGNSQILIKDNEGSTRIFAWGDNENGVWGNGNTTSSLLPIEIKLIKNDIGVKETIKNINSTKYNTMISVNDGYQDHLYISGLNRSNIIDSSNSDQQIFSNYQKIDSFIKKEPTLKVNLIKKNKNSIVIKYNLERNDANKLIDFKLYGDQVSSTNQLDLLNAEYGWGEHKIIINNLDGNKTYQDWYLSYETDLNKQKIEIEAFEPTFEIKLWMWIALAIILLLIGLIIWFIIFRIRERRMLKRILAQEQEELYQQQSW